MIITYENEKGSIKLFGSGNHELSVCEVTGLEPPEKSRSLKTYIGEDGSFEDSSRYLNRTITVSGDMKIAGDPQNKIREICKILSKKGVLTVESGGRIRKTEVNSASFTVGKRYNSYLTFVIQMICDYPHFDDGITRSSYVFMKHNKLSSNSRFPLVLSNRTSEGIVNNAGDIKIYPKIVITKNTDIASENFVEIENKTTGNKIILERAIQRDEVISIDVKNRTVTSSIDGNIIGSLDLYSKLSGLWCDTGENVISVKLDGRQGDILVYVEYTNEYLEAL